MANVLDVAEFILGSKGAMDTMKLQKLVYYAQAWTLVWTGRQLYDEQIEAWANGPVVRSLYAKHRGSYAVAPGVFGGNPEGLSSAEKQMVKIVLDHYGSWTGRQLSDLAHSEQPWISAREGLGPTERGNRVIDPLEMQDHYAALVRTRANA